MENSKAILRSISINWFKRNRRNLWSSKRPPRLDYALLLLLLGDVDGLPQNRQRRQDARQDVEQMATSLHARVTHGLGLLARTGFLKDKNNCRC